MKILCMDESGHHNLDPNTMDPKYPIFVLSGCIFEEKSYEDITKKLNKLKMDFFDSEEVIFHTL